MYGSYGEHVNQEKFEFGQKYSRLKKRVLTVALQANSRNRSELVRFLNISGLRKEIGWRKNMGISALLNLKAVPGSLIDTSPIK